MKDRLKTIRLALGLSQEEFGSNIGIKSRAHISALESGARNITDRVISDVCSKYSVNEKWLRFGQGEMFTSGSITPADLANIAEKYDLDRIDQNLIMEYLKLEKPIREKLKQKIRDIFLDDDEEAAIDREVEAYREELRAEKGEKSSASGITDAKEA